jgi:hypothetical protein
MKDKLSVRLEVDTIEALSAFARRKRLTKSVVVEAAVSSFLSPDHHDQREAAYSRRIDRLTRKIDRLDRNTVISAEAVALFIHFWLSATPPIPSEAMPAAQAKGRERYDNFVKRLTQRLQQGKSLVREIPEDIAATAQNDSLRE